MLSNYRSFQFPFRVADRKDIFLSKFRAAVSISNRRCSLDKILSHSFDCDVARMIWPSIPKTSHAIFTDPEAALFPFS